MSAPDRTKAPAVSPMSDIRLTPADETVLSNGIRLTTVRGGDQPLVRLAVMAEGGRCDFMPPSAVSIMGEAMREGAGRYTGAEIADMVDYNGARLGSRISDHHNGIDLIVLNSRIGALLPVLHEMITAPAFDDKAVDVIRRRQSANRAVQLAKVAVRASAKSKAMIAGAGHRAAVTDTPDDIITVTADDLRRCHAASYGSAPLRAYMAGNFSDDDLDRVKSFLESLPAGGGVSPISVEPFRPEEPSRYDDVRPDALQSAISMSLPAIPRSHPDYIPLRLAVMALGGYFGSRLMSNIREEKGLTYGIGASLQGSFEGAFVSIEAQCDASDVDCVIEESLAEVRSLVLRPMDADELNRLKLKAWSALASTADSPMSVIDYHITRLVVGTLPDYFDRQMSAIAALTSEDVAHMAESYLVPGKWRIAVSGAPVPV